MCMVAMVCLGDNFNQRKLSACEECVMATQVSYAIGVAQPLSVFVDTYGTGTIADKEILAKILEKFDFRPGKFQTCPSKLEHRVCSGTLAPHTKPKPIILQD